MKLIPIKVPKDFLSEKKYMKVVEDALDAAALAAQSNVELTVKTWEHPVSFTISHKVGEGNIATDDEICRYVEHGTRPHLIGPRRSRYLRFAVGGRPKTRPGQLGSGGGAKGSKIVYFRGVVSHPGTKPRLFAKQVARMAQDRLLLDLHTAFGH